MNFRVAKTLGKRVYELAQWLDRLFNLCVSDIPSSSNYFNLSLCAPPCNKKKNHQPIFCEIMYVIIRDVTQLGLFMMQEACSFFVASCFISLAINDNTSVVQYPIMLIKLGTLIIILVFPQKKKFIMLVIVNDRCTHRN